MPEAPAPDPNVAYVSFSAEISQKTTEALLGLIGQLSTQGTHTVHLLLSTPGGAVMCGMNLYNMLRGFPCHLVTHNVGSVDSIGNVIFLAGEERYANARSTFMFHGVGFDITQKTRLEEKLLRERLDSLQADQQRIGEVIVERTNIPADEVRELFLEAKTRDPEYAVANGIIDEIREVQVPAGAPFHQLVFQR